MVEPSVEEVKTEEINEPVIENVKSRTPNEGTDFQLYYTHGPGKNIAYDNIRTPSGKKLMSRHVGNSQRRNIR
jgi:hypothetical protein